MSVKLFIKDNHLPIIYNCKRNNIRKNLTLQHWYTFYTKPRAESQVVEALEARKFETYLPTVKVWRARRRRVEEEPLFSCYLFARLDLKKVGPSAVAWTPGLRHIVGAKGGRPTVVPDKIIAYIQQRIAGMEPHRPGVQIKPGDPARITAGPLKDLDAVFEQHLSNTERAQVLVRVLGRLTRYNVSLDWLEPI